MAGPTRWDALRALAGYKTRPWRGRVWRAHWRTYSATGHGGSLRFSGRYNRGSDQFPEDQIWPALYLALRAEATLGEIIRHVTPELLGKLNDFRISELQVELAAVLDCRDAAALGLATDDLIHDYDFEAAQELAAAAIARNAEGILVPSATGLGDNLIVFPARLRSASRLVIIDSRDPRLYVKR
ncbi:MAG: RES domain-containing protein [Dehalococcoidia bacterium]